MRFVSKKLYLSGSDWVINLLDYLTKTKTSAGGCSSQIVLVLDSPVDAELLQGKLTRFLQEFPLIRGTVTRDLNLAPYWKIPKKPADTPQIEIHRLEDTRTDLFPLLESSVNRQFKTEDEHLAFRLIECGGRESFLVMTFDHLLFDAFGAEAFLNLFREFLASDDISQVSKGLVLAAPAQLSEWMKKFYAGRNVNRKMIALSASPPEALSLPLQTSGDFHFRLISFDTQETAKIYETAYATAGYLMEVCFLLPVIIQTVHQLFAGRGVPSSNCLVPMSINLRTGKDIRAEIFLNHVSYIFFQIPTDLHFDGLIAAVKEQMYDQVKSGLSQDIVDASLLTRIAPLALLKVVSRLPFKGKIASFCFSHLGRSAYLAPELNGVTVRNLFHMPRLPVPPGLGFFFNCFNGRLNLMISYLDGLLSEEEAITLETGIRHGLTACQS
ncbi:MAG: hypothetical protein V1736_03980 [Pseudomonadota bacterium]